MNIQLDPREIRVLGALIEKAITTADQYPLSLNALVNACNQKSNRDPLMELDERTAQETLETLAKKHLVVERAGYGSRVPKYQHRFCNTGFGALELSAQELALLCELLLRGAQTPGELRTRASRMAEFASVAEVEAALTRLMERAEGPFVVQLEREPNRRDARYMHLLGGAPAPAADARRDTFVQAPQRGATTGSLEERVAQLERLVDELQHKVGLLQEQH